jgi:hypothetical protein
MGTKLYRGYLHGLRYEHAISFVLYTITSSTKSN